MLILIIVAFVLLLFYICMFKKDLPPGPWGLPIVGYLPWLDPQEPHLTLTELAETYGPIYSLQMGTILTVVLTDPKIIRQALALEAFNGRAPLYLTHGLMNDNGIICAQGEKWKDQRKFVITTLKNLGMVKFGEKRMAMEERILKGVEETIKKIHLSNGPVNTGEVLMHCLGNVLFELVFGRTWAEEDIIWKKLQSLQEQGTKLIGVAGPINFLPFLRFLPKYKQTMKYLKNGIEFSHNLYQSFADEYKATSTLDEEEKCHFLGAFLREQKRKENSTGYYTDTQMNFLLADMFGAGVDTTSVTLQWFFLFMAIYEDYQKRIQKEIDEVVQLDRVKLSDLSSLTFTEACILETQRIRSVTPLGIPHGTTKETILNGYKIPKGTMIVPLLWSIHMDPKYHEHPQLFHPERFLTEDNKINKPEAFIPFQTGKRMCAGEEYAKMLLFLFATNILLAFNLELENKNIDLTGQVGITLTPKHHCILFTPRSRQF